MLLDCAVRCVPSAPPGNNVYINEYFSISIASDQNGREDPRSWFREHGSLRYTRAAAVASRRSSGINLESEEQGASDTEHGPASSSFLLVQLSNATARNNFVRLSADWRSALIGGINGFRTNRCRTL